MKHRTFFWFFLPTALAMLVFILAPVISVAVQSVFTPHEQIMIEVESCGPFGCTIETKVDTEAMEQIRKERPFGRFSGLSVYLDRGHLAVNEVSQSWRNSESWGAFFSNLGNLPLYRALSFTLVYTFVATPLIIILGFMIAVAVNNVTAWLKGPVIFFSLLPFVVTPLVGSLILFWMVDARGVIGSAVQWAASDPDLSLKASATLTWIMLIVYAVWHAAPFAFVVFYAGLQTLPQDTLESAMIDGASRWQRIWYIVIPHLMPLITFVALIQLMDNFRVFEPIVGFNASAHATSLSWIIFNDLGGETRQLSSAAANSVLTIIGISILLTPVLIRTWRDFQRKA